MQKLPSQKDLQVCVFILDPVFDEIKFDQIKKECQARFGNQIISLQIQTKGFSDKASDKKASHKLTLFQIAQEPQKVLKIQRNTNQATNIKDFKSHLSLLKGNVKLSFDDDRSSRYSLKEMVRSGPFPAKKRIAELLVLGNPEEFYQKYYQKAIKIYFQGSGRYLFLNYYPHERRPKIAQLIANLRDEEAQSKSFDFMSVELGFFNPIRLSQFYTFWPRQKETYRGQLNYIQGLKKLSKEVFAEVNLFDDFELKIQFSLEMIKCVYLVEDSSRQGISLYLELLCNPKFFCRSNREEWYGTFLKEKWKKTEYDALDVIKDQLLKTYAAQSTIMKLSSTSRTKELEDFISQIVSAGLVIYNHFDVGKSIHVLGAQPLWLTYQDLANSYLPYEIKYALLVCVSQKKINIFHITDEFLTALEDRKVGNKKLDYIVIEKTLKDIAMQNRSFVEACTGGSSQEVFEKAFWKLYEENESTRKLWENNKQHTNYIKTKKVTVTPTMIIYYLPEAELSNSVLRRYRDLQDLFLRVSFTDDRGDPLMNMGDCYDYQLKKLIKEFHILTKTFKFLAFSSSQLRNSSLWMFSGTQKVPVEKIHKEIGDLSKIMIPAKHGARLGQLFSSSFPGLKIDKNMIKFNITNDLTVKHEKGEYTFSDGIGKISLNLLKIIKENLKIKGNLSAIQIRYGGHKGVLVGDPTLGDNTICFRPSMIKFTNSTFDESLEVLDYCKYLPAYLNRQVVILLMTNRLNDRGVQELIEETIRDLSDEENIQKTICQYVNNRNQYISIRQLLSSCIAAGITASNDLFIHGVTESIRVRTFVNLKDKCNILVKKGVRLMGVLDEYGILNYGEIYACISPSNGQEEDDLMILDGKVLVTKNPCLHPGDIKVLKAMKNPETREMFKHLVNCVVFPSRGPRPHTDEISGSDLDGDVYFLSWDERLIPPSTSESMSYAAPPTEKKKVETNDIIDFFVKYISSDVLGRIDNSHLTLSDASYLLAKDENCLKLAIMHSQAVDYAKTGVSPSLNGVEFPRTWPDFMEKSKKKSYRSHTLLGDVYRSVKTIMEKIGIKRIYKDGRTILSDREIVIDEDMVVDGFEEYLVEALEILREYYKDIEAIRKRYKLQTEFEIYSGSFLKMMSANKRKRMNMEKMQELIFYYMKELKGKFSELFKCSSKEDAVTAKKKASACYVASYYNLNCKVEKINRAFEKIGYSEEFEKYFKEFGQQFIGLPWHIFRKILLEIKKENTNKR